MSSLHSLYIINKAGGLIYQRDFSELAPRLSSNEYLVLAGTFHGVHVISSKLSPNGPSSGIEVLEADAFKLNCFQTLTGTKFVMTSDLAFPNIDALLRKIYELYCDYVMKNPFFTPDMPIRCELFDTALGRLTTGPVGR